MLAAFFGWMSEEHELIHFAHFMEAAFGLGIAYTIFEEIHNWGHKTCKQRRDEAIGEWVITEPDQNDIKQRAENALLEEDNEFSNKLSLTIKALKVISFVTGILFLLLLAYVGVCSGEKAPLWFFVLLFVLGILPLCFMVWIYFKWNRHFTDLEKNSKFSQKISKKVTPPAGQ